MCEIDMTRRNIGVSFMPDGTAQVTLWAPRAKSVAIVLTHKNETYSLDPHPADHWKLLTDKIKPGDAYYFFINEEKQLPDPASLCQPKGVHEFSEAVNTNDFAWTDDGWVNPPLDDHIFYELHAGTFTSKGDLAGIAEKLQHLKTLGITAIEIMPIAQFPGERNWGYDGVLPFAVQNSYGGPKALQQLVDLCHSYGIAVVLDVVYNHFGPEGNYFGEYGPFFTPKHHTPWGEAINFDDEQCEGVRRYFIENALMWFRDFHIDALRLDAVHAIKDLGVKHFLSDLKEMVEKLCAHTGRQHYLVAECDLNDVQYIKPIKEKGFGMDAQWIDEFHHALRVTAGQDKTGYYSDFTGIVHLAKSYNDGYVYDGQFSPHRKMNFGTKTTGIDGKQFVVFSQNHDQVGNRMLGERSSVLYSFEMQKLLAAAVIFSPFLPMLFMGEEYGETNPFLYFVSHTDPELVQAVRKGRKAEFASFHALGEAPDPQALETFKRSKLQWHLLEKPPHATLFSWYKKLIELRKLQPALRSHNRKNSFAKADPIKNILSLKREEEEQEILCLMNFSDRAQEIKLPGQCINWKKLLHSGDPLWLGDHEVQESIGSLNLQLPPESILAITNKIY